MGSLTPSPAPGAQRRGWWGSSVATRLGVIDGIDVGGELVLFGLALLPCLAAFSLPLTQEGAIALQPGELGPPVTLRLAVLDVLTGDVPAAHVVFLAVHPGTVDHAVVGVAGEGFEGGEVGTGHAAVSICRRRTQMASRTPALVAGLSSRRSNSAFSTDGSFDQLFFARDSDPDNESDTEDETETESDVVLRMPTESDVEQRR